MKFLTKVTLLAIIPFVLAACSAANIMQKSTKEVASEDRNIYSDSLEMSSIRRAAETVANKMLASRVARKWGNKQPRLALGNQWRNKTHDETISKTTIKDRIKQVLRNSQAVRFVNTGYSNFDYVLNGTIDSTIEPGTGSAKLVSYVITIELTDKRGEFLGSWSEDFDYLTS